MFRKALVVGLGVAALALPAVSQADSFSTYGATTVVTPGPGADPTAFQLTSTNTPAGWAGLVDTITSGVLLDQITQLSADYDMTSGGFGGGAPRFSIADTTGNAANEAYVYWGTPLGGETFSDPNAGGGWANTGNYADLGSSDVRVYVNGFGGISAGNTGITWSQFVAEAGSVAVGQITLDLDGGFSQPSGQQMLVDDFTVNGATFNAPGVPEPTVWSMLILGLAGLGTALRMRPKTVTAV